jgi:hypothetical protein
MRLTSEWKRAIIPRITEQLFTWFTLKEYDSTLVSIITNCSSYHNQPFNCILHKGLCYNPYKLKHQQILPCGITKHNPSYDNFISLIEKKALYESLTKEAVNWLSCGLAMCHTVGHICEVFPEFILSRFANVVSHPDVHFIKQETSYAKFTSFIERNAHIEQQIKRNILMQMMSPGEIYGKDSIQ